MIEVYLLNQIQSIMKQHEPSSSQRITFCRKCGNSYLSDSKYNENDCEKCRVPKSNTPTFTVPEGRVPSDINLEEESPNDLIFKLTKANSISFNEGMVRDANSHEQELQHLSNLTNFEEIEESDSEEENEKQTKEKLESAIRQEQLNIKAERKIFVGSGFTFDMTDFFKFKKKKELASDGQGTFFEEISGSPLAWLILLYTVSSSAMIPGWIMNIRATKFVRKAWRFLMQALFMIPFILYEKRSSGDQVKEKYKLSYIFDRKNITKPYISSLSASLWFVFVLTSFEWTYVSHGIVLGGLSNFFLSISRSLRGQSHQIESGGQVLVILGILLVIQDTLMVDMSNISADDLQSQNTFYMRRTWWQRLAGDLAAIFASWMMSQFSKFTSDLRSYYPPFLSMFLINSFNSFHFCLIVFFLNGGSFSFQDFWGIFSIFSDEHFVSFMYMAIVLAFGQMVSVFLVTRMFPDPIIPALALTLQPFIGSFIVQLGNIQNLPGDFSMIGYLLIFPGILIILMGQCFFQRQKSYTEQSNKKVKRLLEQIQQLKKLTETRNLKHQSKEKKLDFRSKTMYMSQQIVLPV